MILSFDKPKKNRSTEEHNEMFVSDSGIAGTYVPNMSDEDTKKFKAKHIKGDDERVEIRVCIGGVNCNIFVFKKIFDPPYPSYTKSNNDFNVWRRRHNHIKFSVNGKMDITFEEWNKINQAIEEAKELLK